jgi:hypothetical protein
MNRYQQKTIQYGEGLQRINELVLLTLAFKEPEVFTYNPAVNGPIKLGVQLEQLDVNSPMTYESSVHFPPPLPLAAPSRQSAPSRRPSCPPYSSSPETPGIILEGGELGYALSTAYGSILDNPDLISVALIGDGEAETGALATSWHLNKFIDPAKNGVVLPIFHLNGYKISGPTIFGRMSNSDLNGGLQ